MRPRRLLCTTEWHTTLVLLHERSSPRALSITCLLENPPAVPTRRRGRPRVGNNPQHMRHGLSQRDACADAGCDVVAKPDTATPRPSAAAGGRGQSRRSRCAAVPLQLSRQGAEPGRSRANQQQGLAGVAQGPSAPPTAHARPVQPRGCSPDRPRCDCFPPLQLPGEATAAPPENLWEKESAAQLLVVTWAHTLDLGGTALRALPAPLARACRTAERRAREHAAGTPGQAGRLRQSCRVNPSCFGSSIISLELKEAK